MHTHPPETIAWYRHRMLWLVIAIPVLTVVGCALTIFLAINSPDQIIGDYTQTESGTAVARP